jgi:anaerobic magnesium-protoporphyrin IX monomethyl ester cyclase
MKICLINPRLSRAGFKPMPHGLLSLSAAVKQAGHACDILDYNQDHYPGLSLGSYDLVGLSVFTSQLPHAVALAESLPRATRVVWGGIHCLLDPLSILRKFPGHFVVSGEGEEPLVSLLACLERGIAAPEEIPGLSFVREGEPVVRPPHFIADLDCLPDLDFHDLPGLERYISVQNYYFGRKVRTLRIVTGRGCPWNCAFCINSVFHRHGARHRVKSFAKIRREAGPVLEEFGIEEFSPRDDDFFAGDSLVREWADFTREKGLLWSATARFNYLREGRIDAGRLRDLAVSGLYSLGMSVEAGEESLRNGVLNKSVRDSEIKRAVEIIRESGAPVTLNSSFVVYFPGDTQSNRIANLRWMDWLSRSLNVVFSGPQVYRVYPGTRLFELEKGQPAGNLDYYLRNLTGEGCLFSAPPDNPNRMEFYSDLLSVFFNTRYRPLESLPGGQFRATDRRSLSLPARVLDWLFFTVKLRLRYDFWSFFIEPWIIGGLYRLVRSPLKALARLKAARQARASSSSNIR